MPLLPPPDVDPARLVPPGTPEPGLAGFIQAWDSLGTLLGRAMPVQHDWLQTFSLVAGKQG